PPRVRIFIFHPWAACYLGRTLNRENKKMTRFLAGRGVVAALFAMIIAGFPAHAQLSEDTAKQAAQELRLLVTEGTAVIGDLQPAINGGKVAPDLVAPDALVSQFNARYQKAAGVAFDPKPAGVIG